MQPSTGNHTLNVTVGGPTSITIAFTQNGYYAFGRLWTYDSSDDRYYDSEREMWMQFADGPPKTFSAQWGTAGFGGSWS